MAAAHALIVGLFDALFGKKAPRGDAMLNHCLHLAQEWGEDWLPPIQPRLRKEFPHLPEAELDRLDGVARAATRHAYDLVNAFVASHGAGFDKKLLAPALRERYPWVDDRNLSRLYSTGMYYACK